MLTFTSTMSDNFHHSKTAINKFLNILNNGVLFPLCGLW